MGRKYYTVVARDTRQANWEIHFGDYEKCVAEQERDDVLENDTFGYARVICSGDTQSEINDAVAALNAK